MHLSVRLGGHQIVALVDTGSAVTIVSQNVFNRVHGASSLTGPPRALTTFGKNIKWTIGSFNANIGICEQYFPVQIEVVSDDIVLSDMLIGRNLLCQGRLSVDCGGVVRFSGSSWFKNKQLTKGYEIVAGVRNNSETSGIKKRNPWPNEVPWHARRDAQSGSVVYTRSRTNSDARKSREVNKCAQSQIVRQTKVDQLKSEVKNREMNLGGIHGEFKQLFACVNELYASTGVSHIEDPEVCEEVARLEHEYRPVKKKESVVKLILTLTDAVPVHQPARRLAPLERVVVNTQVDEWLRDGIVRDSRSDYASPVVLVKKKDGTRRLCVDYRALNKKIIKDRYPLPIIDELLEKFCGAKVFSTLDLRNGFFHVDVDPTSIKYTSFVTPDGQYEFLKAPFGLCNSPAVFQRYINTVFHELIRENTVVVYMDDLIVAAQSEKENLIKLKRVLKVAMESGLIIRFDKCQFVRRKVTFLGHILQNGTVLPSEEKTLAIRCYPQPKTVVQVQSFLGLAGYFRKFVPQFSLIARPLTDLTRKECAFVFGEDERRAFEELKTVLCSEPVLKIYDPNVETELHTDASKSGYGACLLQCHGGEFHPVMYLSKKTTAAEMNYTSYELEVKAVVYALKKLRIYLWGLKFKIITDCNAFYQTMNKKDMNATVARWAFLLQEFNCEVVHRSGTAMRHVDALSRCHHAVLEVQDYFVEQVKTNQQKDERCGMVREMLKNNLKYKDYELKRDVLYRYVEGSYLLVVPKAMQLQLVRSVHERGHFSAKKIEDIVRREYAVEKLSEICAQVIANCVPCILSSRKMGKAEGMYHPIDKSGGPLHTYHVDHLGPLPSTAKKYQYLYIVVDAFTKFVWLYPVKSTGVSEVLKRMRAQGETFGSPQRIVSDRGAAFTSKDFQEYCQQEHIEHVQITTGVPRGNGQAERINGVIIPALTKLSIEDPMKWYRHVGTLQRFINDTKARSTGRTPFKLMFGVQMQNPEDHRLAKIIEEAIREDFEIERINDRRQSKGQIQKIQEENRHNFNSKRKEAIVYAEGDLVAIRKTQFANGAKIQPQFQGPYRVSRVKNNDRYEVTRVGGTGAKRTQCAADAMKPWVNGLDDDELASYSNGEGDSVLEEEDSWIDDRIGRRGRLTTEGGCVGDLKSSGATPTESEMESSKEEEQEPVSGRTRSKRQGGYNRNQK